MYFDELSPGQSPTSSQPDADISNPQFANNNLGRGTGVLRHKQGEVVRLLLASFTTAATPLYSSVHPFTLSSHHHPSLMRDQGCQTNLAPWAAFGLQ